MIKQIRKSLTSQLQTSLFTLYILMLLAAGIEFLSLGIIPLFINYIISEDINYSLLGIDIKSYLENIPFSDYNYKFIFLISIIFSIKFIFMVLLTYYELSILKKIKLYFSEKVYFEYLNKNYDFFLKKNSSELGRNIITEINNAVEYLRCILIISREIFLILVIGLLLILFDPYISLIGFFIISFFVIYFYILTDKLLKNIAEKRIKLTGDIFKHVVETFSIIKEIKVYFKETFFLKKFNAIQNSLETVLLKRNFITRLPKIVFEFIVVILIIILVAVFSAIEKETYELFVLLSILVIAFIRLLPSFNQLSIGLTHLTSFKASFNIISKEVISSLENKKISEEKFIEKEALEKNECIKFKDVSFKYTEAINAGLNNVSFSIKNGEMLGIIGKSGAGKSTLVNLMLKLLSPDSGKIIFKENNLSCGYVPQDIFLLDNTLRANIALAQDQNDISDTKIKDVIEKCELNEFVQKHKKGLDLLLGERGIRISGGEKQRVGLARALYSKKKIIILDEATSSLDNETEKRIIDSILKLKNQITLILIAHRLSTLRHCDRIIYLENGNLKDEGTLDELLKKYPSLGVSNDNKSE